MSKVPYEVYTEEVEALSVLSPDGEIINKDMLPKLTDDQLKEIMYRMVFTRTWDDRAVNLGRQGRLGFYAPVSGQEATMIGSEYALQRRLYCSRLPRYSANRLAWPAIIPSFLVFPWSSTRRPSAGRC